MDAVFFVIMFADGMIIGTLVKQIIDILLGNSVVSKLLSMILGFASGVGYFVLCHHLGYGETDISMGLFLFILLAPLAVLLVAKAFKDSEAAKNKDNNNNT